jgi:DNA-binding transcriptional ArsR family regulator
MNADKAIAALSALAQETRLAAFRLLVQQGPNGLPAGAIASRLKTNPSTMSHHLGLLERAGLVRSYRVQRQIFYATHYQGMRTLMAFLSEDCCRNDPVLCGTPAPEAALIATSPLIERRKG